MPKGLEVYAGRDPPRMLGRPPGYQTPDTQTQSFFPTYHLQHTNYFCFQ
jgi:hypothetical protein